MGADRSLLRKVQKTYRIAMASGPVHEPKTYRDVPGEVVTTEGFVMTWPPLARMGPPLRACNVDDTVYYYGGNSVGRGGGAAAGHTWNVYEYNVNSDAAYLDSRGAAVSAGVSTADGGLTLVFTPEAGGVYAIELHLTGDITSDGILGPYGFGIRFLKVFSAGGVDLEGIPEINGPDLGGDEVSCDVIYKRPDPTGGRQIILPKQRLVINKVLSYGDLASGMTEYTWEPDGGLPLGYYAPEVLMSGLVQGSTIREDALSHDIAFTIAGAHVALAQAQVPWIDATGTLDGESYTTQITPPFYDEAFWSLFVDELTDELPYWVHRAANLTVSDVIYHLLVRHTNLATFFDIALDQNPTDTIYSTELNMGSVGDAVRALQEGRFGRLYTDRKSIIYCGPDDDLRPNIYRPDPVITLDGRLYKSITVAHREPTVGQVVIKSADTIQGARDEARTSNTALQKMARVTYTSSYPPFPGTGQRKEYEGALFFDQDTLDLMATLLYLRDNAEFPEIELDLGMFPHLDAGQPVSIQLDPHTQEADLEWNSAAGGAPLRAYVIGYSNRLKTPGGSWRTTVRFRQATGP